MSKKRKKIKGCPFCAQNLSYIDYKDVSYLKKYITDRGKILSRFTIKSCNKHQHQLTKAIKRARALALLPYIVK